MVIRWRLFKVLDPGPEVHNATFSKRISKPHWFLYHCKLFWTAAEGKNRKMWKMGKNWRMLNREIFVEFCFMYLLCSTLYHPPPQRFHWVRGCWYQTQYCSDFGIGTRRSNHLDTVDRCSSYFFWKLEGTFNTWLQNQILNTVPATSRICILSGSGYVTLILARYFFTWRMYFRICLSLRPSSRG